MLTVGQGPTNEELLELCPIGEAGDTLRGSVVYGHAKNAVVVAQSTKDPDAGAC